MESADRRAAIVKYDGGCASFLVYDTVGRESLL